MRRCPRTIPSVCWMGYFPVEGKTVTCALDTKAYKTMVEFHYADSIRVEKTLNVETDVLITVGGRESRVNSLASEFANAGVMLPTRDVHWLDEQLRRKEADDATPPPSAKKQRLSAGSDGSPAESAAGQTSSNVLSAALRKRLQEKMRPPK